MSVANNAKCSICNKEYYMCNSCKDFSKLYPYKLHTDTAEHFKVYQIIHGYSTKVYTKKEAQERFKNVDLSDMDSYRENIRKVIQDILQYDIQLEDDQVKKNGKIYLDKSNAKDLGKKKDIIAKLSKDIVE